MHVPVSALRRSPAGRAAALPPFPTGWYALAFSKELAPGELALKTLAGREICLFRTERGALVAMDPVCPHLGAHMGHGGKVVGETLRCPFHAFRFGPDGACVATGYDSKPPRTSATTYPVCEVQGGAFVHFDPAGRAPTFTLPREDMSDFGELYTRHYRLRGHPQDTTENSVDLGHLAVVHGYSGARMEGELATEGPHLSARYAMHHPFGLARGSRGIDAQFVVNVWGLGYSYVQVTIPALGIETRNFVWATPVAAQELELRVAMAVKRLDRSASLHPALRLLARPAPLRWGLERVLGRQSFAAYTNDVEQDFAIWEHKVFVPRPALAAGDGPILRYRRWAEQFYEEPPASSASAAGPDGLPSSDHV